ncbi:hypothetical protein LK09_01940 [Microbacterium mangrovi]|uniref:Polyketide cyclase n=1 Tax=Microbacterium mangrovi TaxID=1348253 RepID=A0A0B2ACE4_9MICO|nr:SRPBCC family protein [Microbacterium mangrovi]KHK99443.1 hypothetical protein LK09_01940 [Microbacterium mangrovi]
MTIRTESRITVARDAGAVWDYLRDVARWTEWAPTVRECRIRGGGPFEPGARVEQRAHDFGVDHRRTEQVTRVDAPRAMEFAGTMGSSRARWGMELQPAGEASTHATMWVEVDLANVMRVIPGRVLRDRVQRTSDREMAAIRWALERGGEPGAP